MGVFHGTAAAARGLAAPAILVGSLLAGAQPALSAATTYSCAGASHPTSYCLQGNGARVTTTDEAINVWPEGATGRSSASSLAAIGTLKVMASAVSDTIPDTRNYSSASAGATASWGDNVLIEGGPKGTRGFFTAKLGFRGSTAGGVSGVTSLGNVGSVNIGYDLGGIGFSPISYKAGFSNSGGENEQVGTSSFVNELIDVRINFHFGFLTGIGVFLGTSVQTGAYTHWDEDGAISAGASSDFGNTLLWGGITGVFEENGTPLPAYTVTAESGFDYTRSLIPGVPEPATWAILIVGFGLVGTAARSRRRGDGALATPIGSN